MFKSGKRTQPISRSLGADTVEESDDNDGDKNFDAEQFAR